MANNTTTISTIHPAVAQALDVFPAELADQAAAALQIMLRDCIAADGARAWSSSRLTGDGFPVEITFTTADDRLRYTVEPAGQTIRPQQRLDAALQALDALSPATLPEGVERTFRSMQQAAGLSFGAWIGGRHSLADSQYKIYVETPDAATVRDGPAKALAARLGDFPAPTVSDRSASLRMVAFSPATEQWELYYRVQSLAPHHVPGVLAPAGLSAQAKELLHYLRAAYGYPLGERLPGASVGMSYTFRAAEAAPGRAGQLGTRCDVQSVTLFFFARALWGGDARIRRQFGRLSTALGWDDRRYQQLTAALASRRTWKTYHGIVGLTVLRNGHIALSIGVRPLETAPVSEQ